MGCGYWQLGKNVEVIVTLTEVEVIGQSHSACASTMQRGRTSVAKVDQGQWQSRAWSLLGLDRHRHHSRRVVLAMLFAKTFTRTSTQGQGQACEVRVTSNGKAGRGGLIGQSRGNRVAQMMN